MQKHPRQVFSIVEDGLGLSLAHVFRENNQLYVDIAETVALDTPIYLEDENSPAPDIQAPAPAIDEAESIDLDEYEESVQDNYRTDPYHNLLSPHQLKWGVVALNVNDDNLVRVRDISVKKQNLRRIVRDNIDEANFRANNWQISQLRISSKEELWIHQGRNKHLEQLLAYQTRNRIRLYYQIADANDIYMADYFKQLIQGLEKRIMLVILGQYYRKVLVFENGNWLDSLTIQLTQSNPEPDIVFSKLSLAIDSSPYNNPDALVLCGDQISVETLDYLRSQFDPMEVSLLGFPQLVVTSHKAETYEPIHLAKHALPIALGIKAMNPEAPINTRSDFLPSSIVEGQKVFKVAWHGIILLILLFVFTTYFTTAMLKSISSYNHSKQENGRLEILLAQKRTDAEEIQEIRSSLDVHQQNLEAIKVILDKKNPWTMLLEKLNRTLRSHPTSWIQNFTQDSGRLTITGSTTNRRNVVAFAEMLPDAQIKRVANVKVRNTTLWQFEINSALPEVNWAEEIDREFERLWSEREASGLEAANQTETTTEATSLALFPASALLVATTEQLNQSGAVAQEYNEFITAVQSRNQWQYRDKGQRFLTRNRNSNLAPIVRWRVAYRFYVDKQYQFATQYLSPMLSSRDQYYAHALLLAARIAYAQGNNQYREHYRRLKSDYALNPLSAIFNEDIRIIGD
ncbi:MAG: hypothetical protein V3576_05595 [Candidatus Cloacimonadota bacterium]